MSSKLIVIRPEQTYRLAIELLSQHRLTGLLVVDAQGKLLGILSEREILSACGSFEKATRAFLDTQIRFRKSVKTATLDTPLDEILSILAGKSYRHVPIVDEKGILQGVVSRRDLIRILYARVELGTETE